MSILGHIRRLERTAWTIQEVAARVPEAVDFLTGADKAYQDGGWTGAALHVTAGGGWRPGARALHPALEEATDYAVPRLQEAATGFIGHLRGYDEGEVVEEAPVVAPYADFMEHLKGLTWGVIVVFGAKGEGKSQLVLKLADMWRKKTGYLAEGVGFWDDDRPAWMANLDMDRLVKRMQKVQRFIGQADANLPYDGLDEDDLAPKGKTTEPARRVHQSEINAMKGRIYAVDEAAMFFSSLGDGQQKTRSAASALNNQARHLNSLFILSCQNLSEMPRNLKTAAIQFFKFAPPAVIQADFRAGEKWMSRDTWEEVLSGLAAIKTGKIIEPPHCWDRPEVQEGIERCALAHNWYGGEYANRRAWSYVIASDIGGHSYRGPCPNGMLSKADFQARDRRYQLAAG